jgi:hypothetical protein
MLLSRGVQSGTASFWSWRTRCTVAALRAARAFRVDLASRRLIQMGLQREVSFTFRFGASFLPAGACATCFHTHPWHRFACSSSLSGPSALDSNAEVHLAEGQAPWPCLLRLRKGCRLCCSLVPLYAPSSVAPSFAACVRIAATSSSSASSDGRHQGAKCHKERQAGRQ